MTLPLGSAAADLPEEQRLPALACPWCGCPCAWELVPGGLAGRCPRHGLVEVHDREGLAELQERDRARRKRQPSGIPGQFTSKRPPL